ncbi:MAG: hypothetical protein SOT80_08160 [Candidatus Pseudoruminococcus sp.]|nr:hypothetical protein [Ruminococcus sp.]MDY2783351.1 hypothetical protein [Candidatus Pseudoruminococcus sp.]
MNPNYNNQISGSELIRRFFTRTSMLTVTVASAILSALIIFQTIIYSFSGDKISIISSLYYLFDNQNIEIINAVFGSIISLVSILFFISFLSIYLKAKTNDSITSGLSMLTVSSVIYIIVTCITLTLAFASISVQRYESYKINSVFDSREFSDIPKTYTATQANYDFLVYILFGASALLLGIGAVRISLAMKKASSDMEIPSNRGGALFLSGSISAIVLTTIAFFTSLSSLVIPDTTTNLKPITLLSSIINVLIFATAAALFYGLAFLSSNYTTLINKTYPSNAKLSSYYAGYATNAYPTNANRPPVPPVTPYIQTRNQLYAAQQAAQQNPQYTQPYQPQYTQVQQPQKVETPVQNDTTADVEPPIQPEDTKTEAQPVTSGSIENEE